MGALTVYRTLMQTTDGWRIHPSSSGRLYLSLYGRMRLKQHQQEVTLITPLHGDSDALPRLLLDWRCVYGHVSMYARGRGT